MLHRIELSETFEEILHQISQTSKTPEDIILRDVAEIVLAHDVGKYGTGFQAHLRSILEQDSVSAIRSHVDVMGGDACIRDTRIAVWLLVRFKQGGWSDQRLLENYPVLTSADLSAAWDFYASHASKVDAERRAHEEAA